MVESVKLKARIVELNLTHSQIIDELEKYGCKMAYSTFSQKINNTRTLTLKEADALQQILQIPDEDFKKYFFSKMSQVPAVTHSG